jgi:FkbM family methyltransferase
MQTRLEKFRVGIRNDFWGTMVKVARFGIDKLWSVAEYLVMLVFRFIAAILPSRTKTLMKYALNPMVKLDYERKNILLHADTPLNIIRARACQKEPETVQWIETYMKPGDIFYDVGANVGAYSLVASKFVGDNLTVYSFEPSFSTYAQLCKNIVVNDCQDTIHPFLVTLTDEKSFVWFGYRSLESGSADHSMKEANVPGSDQNFSEYRQKMLGMNIDYLISDFGFPIPTHVKLDVDGAEFLVLKGAANTLKKNETKSILVEVRLSDGLADKVTAYLGQFGYGLHARYDRGDGVIWNYIFTKS